MQHIDWGAFIGYFVPSVFGFGMRFFQERSRTPKPDVWKQLMASAFISYLAFYIHPSVQDTILWGKRPMQEIHVWLAVNSYLGSYIVTQIDKIARKGFRDWIRDRAQDVLAYTDKKRK